MMILANILHSIMLCQWTIMNKIIPYNMKARDLKINLKLITMLICKISFKPIMKCHKKY